LDEAKAEEEERQEKELDNQADNAVAQLLAGKSITLGIAASAVKDTTRKEKSKRKGSKHSAHRSR